MLRIDVMVSYATKDESFAQLLIAEFQKQGLRVAPTCNTMSASIWEAEAAPRLASAAKVVVIWSHASSRSRLTRLIARTAADLGKLIFVQIDHCATPAVDGASIDLESWEQDYESKNWQNLLNMLPVRQSSQSK